MVSKHGWKHRELYQLKLPWKDYRVTSFHFSSLSVPWEHLVVCCRQMSPRTTSLLPRPSLPPPYKSPRRCLHSSHRQSDPLWSAKPLALNPDTELQGDEPDHSGGCAHPSRLSDGAALNQSRPEEGGSAHCPALHPGLGTPGRRRPLLPEAEEEKEKQGQRGTWSTAGFLGWEPEGCMKNGETPPGLCAHRMPPAQKSRRGRRPRLDLRRRGCPRVHSYRARWSE